MKHKILDKKIFSKVFFVFIFIFLITNIIFSQNIPQLYFEFINEGRLSEVNFLQKIRPLSVFNTEFKKSQEIYGPDIAYDVFKTEEERNLNIKNLELILQKNPKSRDVLYNLHLLYNEKGEKNKAEIYLQQAKSVDPNIN